MTCSLIKFLGDQPLMMVLRGLLVSSKSRHLRDLAKQYSLSVGGVSDILRRLDVLGVLKEEQVKNRKCLSLNLVGQERECLKGFFEIYQNACLEERARRFSLGAYQKFAWIDDAREFAGKMRRAKK